MGFGGVQRFGAWQVAIAFCANKGIVPMCGCRKPKQVEELAEAVKVKLSAAEILKLETAADRANAKIMGPDLFRIFVRKIGQKRKR